MACIGRSAIDDDGDVVMGEAEPSGKHNQAQNNRLWLLGSCQHSYDKGKPLSEIVEDRDQTKPVTVQQNTSISSDRSAYSRSTDGTLTASSVATSVSGCIPRSPSRPVLVAYLAIPQWDKSPLILVKAGLGRGSYGAVSVWQSVVDRKLYVRKLQRGEMYKQPTDVTRYIPHPNVPGLLSYIEHGHPHRKSKPSAHVRHRSSWWSTIHDFVNGPTLLSILKEAQRNHYRLPEPLVWKCGLTLLDIVRKFLFYDRRPPIRHNDIFARNILVTNDIDQETPGRFHLIDFGIATTACEKPVNHYDLYCISDVLFEMMLGYTTEHPRHAYFDKRTDQGPYSSELKDMVCRLGRASDVAHWVTVSKLWLDNFIAKWRTKTNSSFEHHRELGTDLTIPFSGLRIQPVVRVWHGENAVLDMHAFLDNSLESEGCRPLQKALIDLNTFTVTEVDARIQW